MSTLIGVAWYDPAEWDALRAVAPDAQKLEPTHAEWLAFADARLAELRAAGQDVRRVPVKVDALQAWCTAHRRRPDASARAEYVSAELARLHELGLLGA
jgi:hypothetical protein